MQPFLCNARWTIETKYYSADISVWTAHLGEDFSLGLLPNGVKLAALVMVFDMSDVRTYIDFFICFMVCYNVQTLPCIFLFSIMLWLYKSDFKFLLFSPNFTIRRLHRTQFYVKNLILNL